MYSIHATKCQKFSLESAHNLMLIVMMISLSIRQPWQTVKNNLTDVMINGLNSTALNWKAKLNTYNYMLTNKSVLHGRLLAIKNSNKTKVLICTHCFFDNPHGYGGMIFLDFYEWLVFLGEISKCFLKKISDF